MKKIFALVLTIVMVLTLAACGGKTEPSGNNSTDNTQSDTVVTKDSRANGDGSYRFMYGWDNHEVTLYTPDGVASEGTGVYDPKYVPKENVFEGMSLTFEAEDESWYCQARDLQEDQVSYIEHLAQFYFEGKVDDEGEYTDYKQTVTDLGFKWIDLPVKMIVSDYTSESGIDWTQTFVGVEYSLNSSEVSGKGLLGLDFFYAELTQDQFAYVAGQIFGVDSGVKDDPFKEGGSAPTTSVDASKLLGTWLQRDSDWDDTFIFNADGTGVVISGPEYPFTYAVNGDILTLTYDDGDQEEFTISVDGDLLTMIDKWDEELLLDKKTEEAAEPVNDQTEAAEPAAPTLKELIIGTWEDQETEYKETFTFKEDGTGKYSFEDDGHWEYTFTYSWYDGDYLEFIYDDDGSVGGFTVRIEGDVMYLSNTTVVDMPLVRK